MWIILLSSIEMFIMGLFGIFVYKRHILLIYISLELIMLSSVINFVAFSIFLDDIVGQIYGLIVLVIGAAEIAVGLSMVISYYRKKGNIFIDNISGIKG